MKRITIDAPAGLGRLELAQYVMGDEFLLKAERLKYSTRTFQRYQAMQESAERFEKAYEGQLDKILKVVSEYASDKIVLGGLDKADRPPYRSIANPQHLADIRGIVSDYHLAFVATQVGPGFVSAADIQRLIDSGILPQGMAMTYQPGPHELPAPAAEVIADAYNYGISMGRDPRLRGVASVLGLDPWRSKHGEPELSSQELAAQQWASTNAANTITGLGNRLAGDFTTAAIESDGELRARFQADVRQELDMNIERQESWRKLASDLGNRTQDWSRDFKRIAATEKQQAMQQGLAAGLIEREGDPDEIMVAKQPSAGACERCVALHYTAGEGSPLRIFKLSELQANGTNVGKKQGAWLPTIGPLHPWCFPAGHGVKTRRGQIPIEQVRVGDEVWTHLARWRQVKRVSKRFYRGDLIELLVSDKLLKVTPEHPFLTKYGWVAADEIQRNAHIGAGARQCIGGDVHDHPPECAEVGFLALVLRAFSWGVVPVAGANLDAQQVLRVGQVAAKRPDGVLRQPAQRQLLSERGEHERLVVGHHAVALPRQGTADLLRDASRAAANSIVRGMRNALALLGRAARSHQAALFTERSDGHARAAQPRRDGAPRSAVGSREGFDAHAPEVGVNDGRHREGELGGHDVAYHGVPVMSTRRAAFEGYVYNFAVDEDESYECEGFVAHNCACELIHVPLGWGFDEDGSLVPESMLRSELLPGDLRKAGHMTWGSVVPERGVAIRLGDPRKVAAAEAVVASCLPEIFDKRVGITLICEDEPRVGNALDEHDLAYWTGNEIRVSGRVSHERLTFVLQHELGHSLNVWLMYQWGGEDKVIKWHRMLYKVSKREGFVTPYAATHPIENAAELTRLYLFERKRLVLQFPLAFSKLDAAYGDIWRKPREQVLGERPGEPAKQRQDVIDKRKRGGARL